MTFKEWEEKQWADIGLISPETAWQAAQEETALQELADNHQFEKSCENCVNYQFEGNSQWWCSYKDSCKHSPETQNSFWQPKPKFWYEQIPESGVLCKVCMNFNAERVCTANIVKYDSDYGKFVDDADSEWDNAIPITPEEIEKLTYKGE